MAPGSGGTITSNATDSAVEPSSITPRTPNRAAAPGVPSAATVTLTR